MCSSQIYRWSVVCFSPVKLHVRATQNAFFPLRGTAAVGYGAARVVVGFGHRALSMRSEPLCDAIQEKRKRGRPPGSGRGSRGRARGRGRGRGRSRGRGRGNAVSEGSSKSPSVEPEQEQDALTEESSLVASPSEVDADASDDASDTPVKR